jgi:S-adenosylmethionine decarboxylase
MEKESVLQGYGPHLMLDLNESDPAVLNDLEACFNLLNTLPSLISMTKITQPYVFRYRAAVPEDDGITGVVIIAESHISLHTYPAKNYVFVDIFSCKPFNADYARDYVIDYFKSKKPHINLTIRGLDFPTNDASVA